MLALLSCQSEKKVYLFSYFTDNGQDGLHFAYSHDGYEWMKVRDASFLTPELAEEKLMRDPCIIEQDGTYHMVWTVGWTAKGIGHASSTDLIHWSEQQYIPVMEHEANARNCWAPELIYDADEKLYYIYWATTIPGQFMETDSTAESGYNHRMYYTTTRDWETFSETKLFYDAGYNVIDATILPYESSYLMWVKDETKFPTPEKNIRLTQGEHITGPYDPISAPITGDYWAEGPTPIKIGQHWIVYFDKYRKHNIGAVRSSDLDNWEDISDQVSFPDGVRHGTVFQVPESILHQLQSTK